MKRLYIVYINLIIKLPFPYDVITTYQVQRILSQSLYLKETLLTVDAKINKTCLLKKLFSHILNIILI